MTDALPNLTPQLPQIGHSLLILAVAAVLGAALGLVRPVRNEIVPRSAHVVQTQILLAIVGAIIIVIVVESLARAFAIVGAAALVRFRARIDDPKDAGVMLIALAVGLATGSGLFVFAIVSCVFVIAVLWLLERITIITPVRIPVAPKREVHHVPEIPILIHRAGAASRSRRGQPGADANAG